VKRGPVSGIEVRVQLDQGLKAVVDVRPHRLLGVGGAAVHDGGRDHAVIRIGRRDTLGGIERGEEQAIDGHIEALEELGDVAIARAVDDQVMPCLVETRESVMIACAFPGIHFVLDFAQASAQGQIGASCAFTGSHAFQGHARLIDLAYLVGAELLDGCAPELLDGDQAFGFETAQGLAHLAATDAGCGDNIGFDQALAWNEAPMPDAFPYPFGNVDGRVWS
jgi:hypothetical protein